MLKMKNIFTIGWVLLIMNLIISCEKEGPAGKDGNANVKTEIIKVFGNDWTFSDPFYIVDKPSALLTQDIIDNGSAFLYLEAGEGMWMALPYQTMGFGYGINDLGIWTEGTGVATSTTTYKLVVIQGNMEIKSMEVDFNNYIEVKEYFNIVD